MKTVLSLLLVASSVVSATVAGAADNQPAVYGSVIGGSVTGSLLSPSPVQPTVATAKKDMAPVRNVRIVLQSPYGN